MLELADARRTITKLDAAAAEPIAIVSMACRFPGGADTPERFWDLVRSGRDVVGPLPDDRGWDPEGDGTYTPRGGFLDGIGNFDAEFFGISPREALAMDPQQRLVLELSWEVLERAGLDPRGLSGTGAGVYLGVTLADYADLLRRTGVDTGSHLLTGNAISVVSGRIAYTLGLRGPAVSLDAACASSLVTVHDAVAALRSGEISLGIAGGVTLMSTTLSFAEFAKMGGLSKGGRCAAFAEDADGIVWSEGAGVVLLERLSDARANGHPVLGLVRGSAVNQDGASNSLSTPHGKAQQQVIRAALDAASLTVDDIDVVEAHGTGTPLGDPIEAGALLATYGTRRAGSGPVWLGSVKSNIGHTQGAAGIAGLIKMVLAMQHEWMPATLHAERPSTRVDWDSGAVRLLQEARAWPGADRLRRAAVSSFGISGTNAHVIVEQAPDLVHGAPTASGGAAPWVLTARRETSLREQARRLAQYVHRHPDADPAAVGAALAARSRFASRLVVDGTSSQRTAALLAAADGIEHPELVTGRTMPGSDRVVLVFPGQGGQWAGMAEQMMVSSPAFAAEITACAEALAPYVGWSLTEVLTGEADPLWLEQVDIVQPALFAVMLALAAAWRALGVSPAAVVGHSQGEIAAAVVAGVLSREDGARIVAQRAQALRGLSGTGGMVSIEAPLDHVRRMVADLPPDLTVAAVNGPLAVVVGGSGPSLDVLLSTCDATGTPARRVAVDYASHTPGMTVLRDRLLTDLAGLVPAPAAVPFYSTVQAAPLAGEKLDAEYWYHNLREPVEFARTVEALLADGFTTFLECSPHPLLIAAIKDVAEAAMNAGVTAIGTLRRRDTDAVPLLRPASELFVRGTPVAWPWPATADVAAVSAQLPVYAFHRSSYWPAATGRPAGDAASWGLADAGHGLLGAMLTPGPDGDGPLLTGRLSLATAPWLADHQVRGTPLLPGTALVECALRAGKLAGFPHLSEMTLHAPLLLPPQGSVELRVQIAAADEAGDCRVLVHARPDTGATAPWTLHGEGRLTAVPTPARSETDFASWPPPGAKPISTDGFYEALAARGYDYGPAFRGLRGVWRRGADVFADVALPDELRPAARLFGLHPALFDAALQAGSLGEDADRLGTVLPFAWSGVRLHAAGASALRVRISTSAGGTLTLTGADATGALVLTVDQLVVRPLPETAVPFGAADGLYQVDWVALPAGRPGDDLRNPLCLPDPATDDLHTSLTVAAERLRARLRDSPGDERIPVITRQAAVVVARDRAAIDPVAAAVTGFVRSVQAEFPGRLVLVDVDAAQVIDEKLLGDVAACDEPELAVRGGQLYGRRLVTARTGFRHPSAAQPGWRVEAGSSGSVESLAVVDSVHAERPLGDRDVRVAVRYAGVNFRDGLLALGLYPETAEMGSEGAGVVTTVGRDVSRVRVGQAVMGAMPGAFGPDTVVDERVLAPVPENWTFAQAASVPLAFLTAYHALVTLGGVRPGSRVLIHAAAGGVGTAAVQLARHFGAEVFATASPSKWPVLRALGLDDRHIASSRDTGFEHQFGVVSGGAGMDVVLNSLIGELTDASLRLMPRGGVFAEAGLRDIRDPHQVALDHPGVRYRPFKTLDGGLDAAAAALDELVDGFTRGHLQLPPLTSWELAELPAALSALIHGQHIGKLVVGLPRPTRHGTVLITGGTGLVGSLVAKHLVQHHHVPGVLLLSRRGPADPGATQLREQLAKYGAHVDIVACDVTDRRALAAAIDGIPAERPLTGVVHAAAVVEDGLLESVDEARLRAVLGPKADTARHLYELTLRHDLTIFTLFSSMAGITATAGQAAYAAANAYVDALVQWHTANGRPGKSIAWGRWESASTLTGRLSDIDLARMKRAGLLAMPTEQGLALFDAAHSAPAAVLAAARLDPSAGTGERAPALLSALRARASRQQRPVAGAATTPTEDDLINRLAALAPPERERRLLELIRSHTAVVLGHQQPEAIDIERSFRDLGFDSLSSVELRNRLAAATGTRLAPTAIFEHPTPRAMAGHLSENLREPASTAAAREPRAEILNTADLLLRQAVSTGTLRDFLTSMAALADLSPIWSADNPRRPVTLLGRTGNAPTYYLLASLFGKSAQESYWQLSERFSGGPEVRLLLHPGYADGEALPRSAPDVLGGHADSIIEFHSDNTPFVLVGYSSGAPVAHALATELHRRGRSPLGVVMIDPIDFEIDRLDNVNGIQNELARRNEQLGDLGWNWALAMARYATFTWPTSQHPADEILILRATRALDGTERSPDDVDKPSGAALVDIDADHFSVLKEAVDKTSEAISQWAGRLPRSERSPQISG
ncbi:hypothetical protein A6A27_38590 [Micromonospora sp. CB01531]|nr:hypothetical protein A6A27_38590 [Micromonospora sp. CB01531]